MMKEKMHKKSCLLYEAAFSIFFLNFYQKIYLTEMAISLA
jgi:hypothetical protein